MTTRWLGPAFAEVAILWALTAGPEAAAAWAGEVTVPGWFHITWGDAPGTARTHAVEYELIEDSGRAWRIQADESALGALGGARQFNRRRVTIVGDEVPSVAGTVRLRSIQLQRVDSGDAVLQSQDEDLPVRGSQPWVTILCAFADSPTMPSAKSWYEGLMGAAYPGLDHYWQEVSYGAIDLTGSVVVGPYPLPGPRSDYGQPSFDRTKAINDCTAAADPDVDFTGFVGINQMFSDNLDGASWGGTTSLYLEGQWKIYRVTWMAKNSQWDQQYTAHEMGHGFGFPHSSGPYSSTYDSGWDVMSGGASCPPAAAAYGCVGVHTIAYHKDLGDWIPALRKIEVAPSSTQTVVLERLATPPNNSNYLMARVPIGGSDLFYTVEARLFAGYDTGVPGEAVIIHLVDPTRSDRDAQVVDPDGNSNPNDAAAMWTVGETFTDAANGITVSVVGATATGFQVTIANGVAAGLTLTVSTTGSGTVTSNPAGISCGADCAESYPSGTAVTLTATPAAGWVFVGWGGACSGTGQCTLTLTANTTVTATFSPQTFTLSVVRAGTGSGTVTSNPAGIGCGGDCSEAYTSGTAVTLTAAPAAGSVFAGWSGGGCSGTGQCSVTITANTTVTATFDVQAFTLTVTLGGSGDGTVTGTGINCGGDCSEPYTSGTAVTLTAAAGVGSVFGGWSGGGCSGTGQCTVTVMANTTVRAAFSKAFTDDPLSAQVTPVKAVHVTELRQAVATLRSRNGLAAFAYTDGTLTAGATPVRAAHVAELRNALNGVYDALGRARPAYTDSTLQAGQTLIKRAHIADLRDAVRAAE